MAGNGDIALTVALAVLLCGAITARLAARAAGAWWRFRGTRLVVCPDTHAPAAVSVDTAAAASAAVFGSGCFGLDDCSRWPAKAFCGQQCLDQVKADPDATRVARVVAEWFGGRPCAYCGRAIEPADVAWHPPALVTPQGRTIEWSDLEPEELPAMFATHRPACWNCHIAESFLRTHAPLVTHRDPRA